MRLNEGSYESYLREIFCLSSANRISRYAKLIYRVYLILSKYMSLKYPIRLIRSITVHKLMLIC